LPVVLRGRPATSTRNCLHERPRRSLSSPGSTFKDSLRNIGTLNRQRLVVAAVALALIPVALEVDALITIGLLAGLLSALIAYEAIHFREARQRVRAAAHSG